MTLALQRPHFDVELAGVHDDCLLCTAPKGADLLDIIDDGETRQLWSCSACDQRYTTRFAAKPCPNGLPWCVLHEADVDGLNWHRTLAAAVRADRNGSLTPVDDEALVVRGVLVAGDDGRPDPVVWITEAFPPPRFGLQDGIGLSPARARRMAALLTQFADQIEGGEPR